MRWTIVVVALLLAACGHSEPGGIQVRTVQVPVPQPCLPADQIPPEPPKVATLLNGIAAHDLAIVAASALDLRAWGEEMEAALRACAE
jgi:NAD(P)H-dependent FMN reductase